MTDWNAIGTAIGATVIAIGSVAGGAWAWWLKNQRDRARVQADVAGADADRKVADAEGTVYKLLADRLKTVENDVRVLRSELEAERKHSRRLELHIWRLEGLMRKAGLEPPPFHEEEMTAAGGTD